MDVEWTECARVLKKQTRGGEPVRVMLPRGQTLRHGDVIFEDADRVVIIQVRPCEAIVASVAGAREMARLALELGNLHQPAQLSDGEIVFIEDGPPMEVLERLGIPWRKEVRRFEPTPVLSAPVARLAGGFRVIRSQKDPVSDDVAIPIPSPGTAPKGSRRP